MAQSFVKAQARMIIMVILIRWIPKTACAFTPMCKPSPPVYRLSLQQQRRYQYYNLHHRQSNAVMHQKLRKFTSLSSLTSSEIISSSIVTDHSTFVLQALSGLTTYIGLVGYYDRARGHIAIDKSCFVAKQSQVEGAGIGLYVTRDLPQGTVIGTYPGVLRPGFKFMEKYESLPQTATYTWRFSDNEFCIDPTDRNGMLQDVCYGGTDNYPLSYFINETVFRFMSVSTLMARINEPPIGGYGCNVITEENLVKREVVFELSRDVAAGEELFMDYGLSYDRSGYGPSK